MSFSELIVDVSPSIIGVAGFVVLTVAVGLARGKNVLISALFATYVAMSVTAFFPFYEFMGDYLGVANEIILPVFIYGVVAVLTVLSVRKYISNTYQHHTLWRTVETVVLSIGVVGLTFASLFHVVHIGQYFGFGPLLTSMFATQNAFFFWLLAPIISFPLFIRP